jgi:phosphoribosylanthranilate isomerase
VGSAMVGVRPDGVYVACGVESSPGVMDRGTLAAFIQAANEAARAIGAEV